MANEPDQPRCDVCYKLLPWSWVGLGPCPMCTYLARVKAASRPSCKPPSYRSPLLALETQDGNE